MASTAVTKTAALDNALGFKPISNDEFGGAIQ
jgi:hypothetical protein